MLRTKSLGVGLSAAAIALWLAAGSVSAATAKTYTATGWVNGVLALGITSTNAEGQVFFRGNVHTARVQSSDARLTGNRMIFVNGDYNADGSASLSGTVYHQVGTWDTAGTNFTATGGLWEFTYHGTMGADNSLQLQLIGSGSGGSIEGMRLDEVLVRAAGGVLDPNLTYQYTGTIQPAPVNIRTVVDNFDDNKITGWNYAVARETNQQFTVVYNYPGVATHEHVDTWDYPNVNRGWSVANGQTLECRVDLVSMSENATNAAGITLWSSSVSGSVAGSYIFFKGRDFIQVGKWIGGVAVFFHEKAVIKNTNVVLSLALTAVNANVVITVRVLDKDNQEAVLYQRSVVDTPKSDPTLTSAELLALSGMKLDVFTDGGPPFTYGDAIMLNAWQYTDGKQPAMAVTYDNLELWTSEIPPLAIDRAVRLAWPASATAKYGIQSAPTPTGPWSPVQDLLLPGMQEVMVPASEESRFFRLR